MPTNSAVLSAYLAKTPGSAALAEKALRVFPGGITHDSRHLSPYALYVERASGARKWDVDGNAYIDYFGGHGALLMGHAHPKVTAAIAETAAKGTHFGASHPLEVAWGERVQKLVASAERVRFTASGTEATHLAVRMARAFTGREKIVRFRTHFHGWHDQMTSGYQAHFDGSPTPGVLPEVAASTILIDPGDEAGLRAALATGEVAAVFFEPTGASFGMIPIRESFPAAARELCDAHDVLLVFDEVITGFRVAAGGAQELHGIRPDLSTFAKILAGGMPGGAVAGRAEIVDQLDFDADRRKGRPKIDHQGTYNANPVAAAAGIAVLDMIEGGAPCRKASATAASLRDAMNAVLREANVPWSVYGRHSEFHIFMNTKGRDVTAGAFDPLEIDFMELKSKPAGLPHRVRLAMLCHGVDLSGWPGGFVSAVHGEAEVDATADAFAKALHMLKADGEIG